MGEGCRHRPPLSTLLPNPVSHLAGAVITLCDQVVPHHQGGGGTAPHTLTLQVRSLLCVTR